MPRNFPRPDFYYLETDGQVFLVKEKGTWRFPKSLRELPCRFEAIYPMPIDGKIVLYAHPILKHHPEHWFQKDAVVGQPHIAPMVERAINRSLPRGAAKVAFIEKGKVLLVKGRRGLTQGMWNLPGGFMGYGEHPETSARRETWEELGVHAKALTLLGIYAETFPRTGGYMLSFVYLGKRAGQAIRPHSEELAEVQWVPLRQAIRITRNPFARAGLRDYLRSTRQP